MPYPGHRRLTLFLASSLLALSLGACGGEDTESDDTTDPSTDDDDRDNPGDEEDEGNGDDDDDDDKGDDTKKPSSTADGGKKPTTDGGVKLPSTKPDGAVAGNDDPASPCDGFQIGARCVKKEHITFLERGPQTIDEPVYDFEKAYTKNGQLKKNSPKIPASADLGEWYMYNGDYVRTGVSYSSYHAAGGKIADADRLPQRDGLNKDLTWAFNAVKGMDGVTDMAAPNCLVCHTSYLEGKMVLGLGRARHFIAHDASGFTLDPFAIIGSSIFTGDILAVAFNDLNLLLRVFGEISYSHLFDLFAGLAMKHDPVTLKWTGDLKGLNPNSGMQGWIEFPQWWNFKKKAALYSNGSGQGKLSNHLWYMNWISLEGTAEAEEVVNNFVHVQKYLEEKVKPPKWEDFGGKIDKALAAKGEEVFNTSCATCHGTYSENPEDETYPNALVDVDEVGTDPRATTHHWAYPITAWYEKSWYAQQNLGADIVKTHGYIAPPLDGIFASAPYLHNGSVRTLEALLDPTKRTQLWTSNMSAGDYDFTAVGWKDKPLDLDVWTLDQNFGIYDCANPGNSNKGHTYGAALTPEQRKQVLEYLKTL